MEGDHSQEFPAEGGPTPDKPDVTGAEIRCFFRDPDGHLIELSEAR